MENKKGVTIKEHKNCPICRLKMNETPTERFKDLLTVEYKCPKCQKTIKETIKNFEIT